MLILTEADFEKMLNDIDVTQWLAYDVETVVGGGEPNPHQDELAGFSLAQRRGSEIQAWYVPLLNNRLDQPVPLSWEWVRPLLTPFLQSCTALIAHNSDYDETVLRRAGCNVRTVADTMLMAMILDMGQSHGLKNLVLKYFQQQMTTYPELVAPYQTRHGRKKAPVSVADVPYPELSAYGEADSFYTVWLRERLEMELKERPLRTRTLLGQDMAMLPQLQRMSKVGVPVDPVRLKSLLNDLDTEYAALETELNLYQVSFTPNSPEAVYQLMLKAGAVTGSHKKQLSATGKTSVTDSWLESLQHPAADKVRQMRQMQYSRSHYLWPFTMYIDDSSRVHPRFGLNAASSGRITSYSPCVTNASGDWDRFSVRQVITAPADYQLIDIDLSQIQARIIAHLSQDPVLLDIYRTDKDVHVITAEGLTKILGAPVSRGQGKTANYALMFGGGPGVLVNDLGCDWDTARRMHTAYFQVYAGLAAYLQSLAATARRQHFTETIYGRRRSSDVLVHASRYSHAQVENDVRALVNHPVQGSEADIFKRMILAAQTFLDEQFPRTELFLQVYDELVFCAPLTDVMAGVGDGLRQAMLAAFSAGELSVPLDAQIHYGKSWSKIH